MIPDAWSKRSKTVPKSHQDLFNFLNSTIEPWDGPSAICATDAKWVLASTDRNGLRPLRYSITSDGLFFAGSESGMIKIPEEKIVFTGNPIRKSIETSCVDASKAKKHFELNPNKLTLVVLGGSLGAKRINNLIAEKLDWFLSLEIQIIWQCGSLYYEKYKELSCDEVKILAFVNEMDQLYASADFIISRAGAATLSELSCVGKPAILIPSPNVAENHQFHNAMAFANRNACLLYTSPSPRDS